VPVAIRPSEGLLGRGARAALGHVRRFARDDAGSVTVEAVLWLPLFFGFLMLVADVSMAFYGKAQAFRLVQDTNRALSVGVYTTSAQARTALQAAMDSYLGARRSQVTMSLNSTRSTVSTRVEIPIQNLMIFGALASGWGRNITVGAAGFLEVRPAS
jgi:Flp pilus assembly protein TadG